MSSEEPEESSVSVRLPSDLADWLDRAADRRQIDRDALVTELIAAHAAIDDENEFDTPASEQQVQQDIDDVRTEFMELIEDVRQRVIQVKRETDGKAPADHSHDDLDQIDSLATTIDQLNETVSGLETDLDEIRSDLDSGFDNYEDILEYLVDTVDDLEQKTTTLARATVQARQRLHDITAAHQRRAAVDELKLAAGQYGIESAACAECGTSVKISLLTAPECPHCAETFSELSPKSGLFGKPTLETGDPPALTGSSESELDNQLEEHLDPDDDKSAADVDWKHQSREGEQ